MWNKLVSIVSAEWLLKIMDNGGAAIVLRSIIISTILFGISLTIINLVDPTRGYEFSASQLGFDIKSKFTWFGVLFGSTYAALYSRFSSQWSYLANLYNSIKQTECGEGVNEEVLAEWKAGFIEDAEYLHLAHKANFASIIHVWCQNKEVCKKYIAYTPGGEDRLNKLKKNVAKR
ncbi:MAG: hypothetical protein ABW100_11115, partial [Candidatus Thiodiazotropha sp. 6PLUC3]